MCDDHGGHEHDGHEHEGHEQRRARERRAEPASLHAVGRRPGRGRVAADDAVRADAGAGRRRAGRGHRREGGGRGGRPGHGSGRLQRVLDGAARPLLVQRAGRLDGRPAVPGREQRRRRPVVDRPRRADGQQELPQDRPLHEPDRRGGCGRGERRLEVAGPQDRDAGGGQLERRHRHQPVLAAGHGRRRRDAGERQEQVQDRGGQLRLLRQLPPGRRQLQGQPHGPVAGHRGDGPRRLEQGVPRGPAGHVVPPVRSRPAGGRVHAVVPVRPRRGGQPQCQRRAGRGEHSGAGGRMDLGGAAAVAGHRRLLAGPRRPRLRPVGHHRERRQQRRRRHRLRRLPALHPVDGRDRAVRHAAGHDGAARTPGTRRAADPGPGGVLAPAAHQLVRRCGHAAELRHHQGRRLPDVHQERRDPADPR